MTSKTLPFVIMAFVLVAGCAEPEKGPSNIASVAGQNCLDCHSPSQAQSDEPAETTSSTPTDDTPFEEPPIDDTPTDDTLTDDTPFEEPPIDDTPFEEPPTDDTPRASDCDFDYAFQYSSSGRLRPADPPPAIEPQAPGETDTIAHIEPSPDGFWTLSLNGNDKAVPTSELVMPDYDDAHPQFSRSLSWDEQPRCYDLPDGAHWMSEQEAWDLYARIVKETLWREIEETPGKRTVVGIRGAYPGTFDWHGNLPDRFNDTMVLMWKDEDGRPNVREFFVNTDTGAYNFGTNNSSSLRPNRHYPYINGWHRGYNALSMALPSYPVRDDTNKNGHWDSQRNGWRSGGTPDYDRQGDAHNIHMASINEPVGVQPIQRWSAGCQVTPGSANWVTFITNAWTGSGDPVDYFLIDARDIAPSVWMPCDSDDGSHACPWPIKTFPYEHVANTALSSESAFDLYNCDDANESGPELVYLLNVTTSGTLDVEITVDDETADPDIHILEGDDADACRARAHQSLSHELSPGRYLIVVDTWVNSEGVALVGEYRLNVDFR